MADEQAVDRHLVEVLDEVLDAVYQAKQAAWATTGTPRGDSVKELVAFLIEWSGSLSEAEERIDGRAAGVSSPSSHQRGNLVAKAHGELTEAIDLLSAQLRDLAADIRSRAHEVRDAGEAPMLLELAAGIDQRIERLESAPTA